MKGSARWNWRATHGPSSAPMNPIAVETMSPPRAPPARALPTAPQIAAMMINTMSPGSVSVIWTSLGAIQSVPAILIARIGASTRRRRGLFGSQGFNRIQEGGFSCRVITKADSDQPGEKYGKRDGARSDRRRPACQTRDERRDADAQHDPGESSGAGQCDGLDQKLRKDVASLGADALTQSDFPRPFAH